MPLMDHPEINDLVKIPEVVEALGWIELYLKEHREDTYAKYVALAIYKLKRFENYGR